MKGASGRSWHLRDYNEDFILEISRNLDIGDLPARLVSTRVDSIEAAYNFLNPKIKSLMPDPYHLKDMAKAVERTYQAVLDKEKICIFADYDVDGATSSALLKNFFDEIGCNSTIYVPDRVAEGYGPTAESMQKIKQQGASLVITVDCGSVAFEALDMAYSMGLEVIVIDHHISMDHLPRAVAVINPNRLDELSSYTNLAAVGVAYLFLVALSSYLKTRNFFFSNNKTPPDLIKYLDIVALGTVCDVMQLTDLNRAFVTQGIKVAKQRKNLGYKTLCDIANINETLNCYHLGFVLGPRINAGGRVGKSDLGARLLSTKSEQEAIDIAKELDLLNQERKAIEIEMLEQAKSIALQQIDEPIVFVVGEGWHPGVIGIIAARLKEKYNKPSVVITLDADGIGKASCRSVRGVDFGSKIIEAKQNNLLVAGGGHAMAAGFTVAAAKINDLKLLLSNLIERDLQKSDRHLYEYYELELTAKAANINFLQEIQGLEPFGVGNAEPIFKFSNLYVLKADIVGSTHIKIIFAPIKNSLGGTPLHAIAFNAVGSEIGNIIMSPKSKTLSVIGKLKLNRWNGIDNVQLVVQDIII